MYMTKNGKSTLTYAGLISIFAHRMKQAAHFAQLAKDATTKEERAQHLRTADKATAYALTARRRADKKLLESMFSHPNCK